MARSEERIIAVTEGERRGDVRMLRAARVVLDGKQSGWVRILPFLGPAFIASVAYMDPGNFATNIQGGAQFGYRLLWVITGASLMAAFLQTLSAKLGIATDTNLPTLCQRHFSKRLNIVLWSISEIAAMATDIAEFTGAALGLYLVFHLPLFLAGLLTGVATFAILALQQHGVRRLEIVITVLVGVIALAYLLEIVLVRPNLAQAGIHAVLPSLPVNGIFLAVGILGATVMPHVLYLHSALMERRVPVRGVQDRVSLFHLERVDIVIAMALATFINLAMMVMAAAAFHAHGFLGITDLTAAYKTLTPLFGGAASLLFGVALLVSGLSSSTVGTMAGQVIMQGFLGWTIPLWLRRVLTMLPALLVLAFNNNPTQVIILTQVVLSFALVAPIVTLLYFTSQPKIMGALVNHRATTIIGVVIGVFILGLNVLLLSQAFGIVK
jgi:manganese transport protein